MMMPDAPPERTLSAAGLAMVLAGLSLTIAVAWLRLQVPDAKPPTAPVSVVNGAPAPVDRPGRPSAPITDAGHPAAASVDALRSALGTTFPTLRDADIACDRICTLTARTSTIKDTQVPESNPPYMGRLEKFVDQHGFTPIDALMIEDAGGDESVLRLSFAPR